MDNVDAALIRYFVSPDGWAWDLRASMSGAAKSLGIPRDAVRSRMQRLDEAGVILGWDVMVHPGLLGTELTRFELALEEGDKDRIVEQMALLEGARMIFDYHGGGITGVFYTAPADQERMARLIGTLAGTPPRVQTMQMPATSIRPTQGTWRLIKALRNQPRAQLTEIASSMRLSTKTVHRRLAALRQGLGAFLTVRTDFTRIDGGMIVEARVDARDPDALRREVDGWPGVTFRNEAGPTVVFSLLVASPMEVTRLRRRLEEMPGTEWVACHIVQRRILVDDWLDAQVDARAGSPRGRAAADTAPTAASTR